MSFGKDWKKIEELVKTRNGSQIRSHAQKFILKIRKILKQRKKHQKKHSKLAQSDAETQFLLHFRSEFICENTPH